MERPINQNANRFNFISKPLTTSIKSLLLLAVTQHEQALCRFNFQLCFQPFNKLSTTSELDLFRFIALVNIAKCHHQICLTCRAVRPHSAPLLQETAAPMSTSTNRETWSIFNLRMESQCRKIKIINLNINYKHMNKRACFVAQLF